MGGWREGGRDGRMEGGRAAIILCAGNNYGVGVHGMEWVHNKEPYFICVRVCRRARTLAQCMHTYCVHVYMCTYVCAYVCAGVSTFVCAFVCIRVCVCKCVPAYACACAQVCSRRARA